MNPKFKNPESLGDRMRRRRSELGLGIEELAEKIQASSKLVEAIEEGKYDSLPPKVYALGFFKKMLSVLEISEEAEWLRDFNNEWAVKMFGRDKTILPIPGNRVSVPYFTPKFFWSVAAGLFFMVILFFLGTELFGFLRPPVLDLQGPRDGLVISHPFVRVWGVSPKESRLTVNGREVTIDERGNFDEELELVEGLNSLEFIVQDRFGKISKEIRHVLVR